LNGREITARLPKDDQDTLDHLATENFVNIYLEQIRLADHQIESFFFLDTPDKVVLAHVSAATGDITVFSEPSFDIYEIVEVRRIFGDALKNANPAHPDRIDKHLSKWTSITSKIAQAIRPFVSEKSHVCLFPGRAFSGLPLHLAQFEDGQHLIEVSTISYAPNFSTFLKRLSRTEYESTGIITIVTVPKSTDNQDFKQRALESATKLQSIFPNNQQCILLNDVEADHSAVLKAMGESREVIFQCHGTTAGPTRGYGICIADGEMLPPSHLWIAEQPDHARFVLMWEDIVNAPEMFVSIACSSGVTETTPSGVRLGLEQTLFSSGTKLIISPLWDVQQAASLKWLESFYTLHYNQPDLRIEEVFQRTCLEIKRSYPHFYFWGAFALNGSVI